MEVVRLLRSNILKNWKFILIGLIVGLGAGYLKAHAAPVVITPLTQAERDAAANSGKTFGQGVAPTTVPKTANPIAATDLAPSDGLTQGNLANNASNNAAIKTTANQSKFDASTDTQSKWGSAFQTLDNSIVTNPRLDLSNDPIFASGDAVLQASLTKDFYGCVTTPPTMPALPPVTDTYSCTVNTSQPVQCTITHDITSTPITPSPKCDAATFIGQTVDIYTTPASTAATTGVSQVITDTVSCDTSGGIQHKLSSTTTTTTTIPATTVTNTYPFWGYLTNGSAWTTTYDKIPAGIWQDPNCTFITATSITTILSSSKTEYKFTYYFDCTVPASTSTSTATSTATLTNCDINNCGAVLQ